MAGAQVELAAGHPREWGQHSPPAQLRSPPAISSWTWCIFHHHPPSPRKSLTFCFPGGKSSTSGELLRTPDRSGGWRGRGDQGELPESQSQKHVPGRVQLAAGQSSGTVQLPRAPWALKPVLHRSSWACPWCPLQPLMHSPKASETPAPLPAPQLAHPPAQGTLIAATAQCPGAQQSPQLPC